MVTYKHVMQVTMQVMMQVMKHVMTLLAWNLAHWASKVYRPVRKSICVRVPDATFCRPYATFCVP